jgi:dGTP triphosphohydrolase
MEACDDTAYCILDGEDAIKKELISPEDLRAFITNKLYSSAEGGGMVNQLEEDFRKADDSGADLTRIREIKPAFPIWSRDFERTLPDSCMRVMMLSQIERGTMADPRVNRRARY